MFITRIPSTQIDGVATRVSLLITVRVGASVVPKKAEGTFLRTTSSPEIGASSATIALAGLLGATALGITAPLLGEVYVNRAAADAAMASVPRLFRADWMRTLDKAKTMPWMPAGRPMRMM